jgi:hypothetical protein
MAIILLHAVVMFMVLCLEIHHPAWLLANISAGEWLQPAVWDFRVTSIPTLQCEMKTA